MGEEIEAIEITCKREGDRLSCKASDEYSEGTVADIRNLRIDYEAGADIEMSASPMELLFRSRHGGLFLKKNKMGDAYIEASHVRDIRKHYDI